MPAGPGNTPKKIVALGEDFSDPVRIRGIDFQPNAGHGDARRFRIQIEIVVAGKQGRALCQPVSLKGSNAQRGKIVYERRVEVGRTHDQQTQPAAERLPDLGANQAAERERRRGERRRQAFAFKRRPVFFGQVLAMDWRIRRASSFNSAGTTTRTVGRYAAICF